MGTASQQDVARLFPGIGDHAVVKLLAMKATIGELESAALLLGEFDEGLIEAKHDAGERLSGMLQLLTSAQLAPDSEYD